METKTNWITVATFSWLAEAELLKTRLESEGLSVNIPEEHLASINPMATGMMVRVQVAGEDAEAAQAVLAEFDKAPVAEACSECGSTETVEVPAPKKNWLVALLGFLFFLPVRGVGIRRVCARCGEQN